jgi:hypothetical protein
VSEPATSARSRYSGPAPLPHVCTCKQQAAGGGSSTPAIEAVSVANHWAILVNVRCQSAELLVQRCIVPMLFCEHCKVKCMADERFHARIVGLRNSPAWTVISTEASLFQRWLWCIHANGCVAFMLLSVVHSCYGLWCTHAWVHSWMAKLAPLREPTLRFSALPACHCRTSHLQLAAAVAAASAPARAACLGLCRQVQQHCLELQTPTLPALISISRSALAGVVCIRYALPRTETSTDFSSSGNGPSLR